MLNSRLTTKNYLFLDGHVTDKNLFMVNSILDVQVLDISSNWLKEQNKKEEELNTHSYISG